MNLDLNVNPPNETGLAAAIAAQRQAKATFGPCIEPCEFEQLLQRAMEILNARHLAEQLKS